MDSLALLREERERQRREALFWNMAITRPNAANGFVSMPPPVHRTPQLPASLDHRRVSFDGLQHLKNGFTSVMPPIPLTHNSAALQNRVSFDDLQRLEAQGLRQQQFLGQQSLSTDGFFAPNRPRAASLPNVAWNPSPTTRQEPTSAPQEESDAPENQRLPAAFLMGLTKMLKDNKNSDIIEWKNGAIFIHQPETLEKCVLKEYFRTDKLESFQRQLHYFGFHRKSGYGKLAPCSYRNPATTTDIQSLLTIKRRKKHKVSRKASNELAKVASPTVDERRIHRGPSPLTLGLPGTSLLPPAGAIMSRSSQEHMRHVEIFKKHQILRLAQEHEEEALRALAAANRQRLLLEGRFP